MGDYTHVSIPPHNNCYCNLQKLLSLDEDEGDSDELCKLHYMNSCILLLQGLFYDIVSH
jgi:hypothetical protein